MSLSPLVAIGTLAFTFVNVLTYLRSGNRPLGCSVAPQRDISTRQQFNHCMDKGA